MSSTWRPRVRFVLPTRNEGGNEGENVRNVMRVLNMIAGNAPAIEFSLRFIDDSDPNHDDATTVAYENLIEEEEFPFLDHACVFRPKKTRWGRLGGAVVDGLAQAKEDDIDFVISGDGDGQHPFADAVPPMLKQLLDYGGLVGASRYIRGGSNEGLGGFYRKAVSRTATILARASFPRAHRNVTDPMSGFFGIELKKFTLDRLKKVYGFKILYEIVATHRREIISGSIHVAQVPIKFQKRDAGDSKADKSNGKAFLNQVWRLRRQFWPEWVMFGIVGGVGFLVQAIALELLHKAGIPEVPAFGMALCLAVATNLYLSRRIIWEGDNAAPSSLFRSTAFWIVRIGAAIGCLWAFNEMLWAGVHHQAANAACVVLGLAVTYPTSRLLLKAPKKRRRSLERREQAEELATTHRNREVVKR